MDGLWAVLVGIRSVTRVVPARNNQLRLMAYYRVSTVRQV
jgi:hypothetical protein